jgi:hypothetical protein
MTFIDTKESFLFLVEAKKDCRERPVVAEIRYLLKK